MGAYSKMWLIQPCYVGHMPQLDANRIMAAFNPLIQNGSRVYDFMRDLGLELELKGQAEYEGGALTNTLNAFMGGYRAGEMVRGTVSVAVPASDLRLMYASIEARKLSKASGKVHRRKKQHPLSQDFHYVCLSQDEQFVRDALANYEDLGRGVRDNPHFVDTIEQWQRAIDNHTHRSEEDREDLRRYIRTAWITVRHHWYQEVIPVFFTLEKDRADRFVDLMEKYGEVA